MDSLLKDYPFHTVLVKKIKILDIKKNDRKIRFSFYSDYNKIIFESLSINSTFMRNIIIFILICVSTQINSYNKSSSVSFYLMRLHFIYL